MKYYDFKVIKHAPILIEGHIHIKAKTFKKALHKLEKFGDYEIEEVKKTK